MYYSITRIARPHPLPTYWGTCAILDFRRVLELASLLLRPSGPSAEMEICGLMSTQRAARGRFIELEDGAPRGAQDLGRGSRWLACACPAGTSTARHHATFRDSLLLYAESTVALSPLYDRCAERILDRLQVRRCRVVLDDGRVRADVRREAHDACDIAYLAGA